MGGGGGDEKEGLGTLCRHNSSRHNIAILATSNQLLSKNCSVDKSVDTRPLHALVSVDISTDRLVNTSVDTRSTIHRYSYRTV